MADTTISGREPGIDPLQAGITSLLHGPYVDTLAAVPLQQAAPAEAWDAKVYDEAYVKQLRSEAAASRVKLKEFEAAETARRAEEEARRLAELSEVDRLKVQLADTEARARTLEVQGVRGRAAAKHGLPEDLHEFITAEDEAGALAQAEKLAAKLKGPVGLPPAGGRNPANGGEQGAKIDETRRLEELARRVPSLNNRILR